jgi:hypothetical protein
MGFSGGLPRWRLHIATTNAAGPWILAGDVVLVKSQAHSQGRYEPGDLVAFTSNLDRRCNLLRVNAVNWSPSRGVQYVLGHEAGGAPPLVLVDSSQVQGIVTSRISNVLRLFAANAARRSSAVEAE